MLKEMSFQLLLEDWQGSSIPDRGGKIIPPARNGERECSGEWFWASLWWYHEASLTSRSQTSGGDVDCHQWVEVGGCWACGCSICKHQCLELDASCYPEPVQGDKEWCNMVDIIHAEMSTRQPEIRAATVGSSGRNERYSCVSSA